MYNIRKEAKEWEREMFFRANRISNQAPHDIYHLYTELEKTSKKYFASGKMKDGDVFKVPMKDGSSITFTFYKKSTAITRCNKNGTQNNLLLERDNCEKEKEILIMLSDTYENTGYGIGERYPEEFKRLVAEARVGDIITFSDSKHMYLCTSVMGSYKHFEKMHEKGFEGDLSKYRSYETIVVDTEYDKTIQDCYDINRNLYTSRLEARVFTDYAAQEWINGISATTEKGNSTTVNFAGLHLLAQKQFDNSLVWYDADKNKVDEDKIKLLYAWFKTSPVERQTILPDNTVNRHYDHLLFMQELEELYKTLEFSKALDRIKKECIESGDGFIYKEKSYVQNSNTSFIPKAFAFTAKDGRMTVSELIFDESGNIEKVVQSSEERFIEFCKEKYNNRYHLFYTRTEEERI